ncbi:N-acetylmuramoyl-L-alanine amidase [Caminicella sporogenes DSM 14501]|uniref:N-acetylmuramoyl-L-alanine amidase n=1 Tax=Caminicella sporogenes DSM 14501 TaxID=1121266 RepID=A0A1M6NVA1_9FIRM|nr:N-acetylmuramoyl-L-alanine amidase family protein [Caminicella sporogenes]RKD21635.1 hypothetical protein BET04_07940 [Caminicella sporogenes]SHJ99636.1 N-acetylmuramoyl-L-alanine amidase [Caminicella sporogenes DSM 14501]
MRRYLSLFLIFFIFFGMTCDVSALKKYERETVHIIDGSNGREYDVKVVNILMGGNDVISDVPGMLFNDRTLVPVRFISENLGAKVTWNQDRKEAVIKTNEKEIILKIDSPIVLVNGEKYTLPSGVPAKLLGYEGNYRTMVPLRFVSEQLGMEVGWIGETMTATIDKPLQYIKDIYYDGSTKFPEIVIKTTGEVETSSFFLEGSEVGGEDRLVVDIPNTILDIGDKSKVDLNGLLHIDIYEKDIKAVRASQFEVNPYKTRIVVDVSVKKGYKIVYDKEKKEVRIKFINLVNDIKIDKIYNVDTVIIKTEEEPAYNIMFLDGKIVVDVLNSLLNYKGKPIEVNKGGIKGVRFSQFKPDQNYEPDDKISRIVVDLEKNVRAEDVYIEHIKNDIYVYVAGKPLDGFDYYKENVNTAKLVINTDGETEYTAKYIKADKEVVLKIEKTKINLDSMKLDIEDKIVKNIRIDSDRSEEYYYIYIELADGTVFVDNSSSKLTDKIILSFINKSLTVSKFKDKLVVIDPGHGGKDPGAMSPNLRIKEKDVVLDVSLKLKKLLETEGFKVYMTRQDDNYIGLYDRATIANELGADVFVSIHANAHSKRSIEGVQVLYYPYDEHRDNKTFAKIMRDSLVKGLGALDRGIIQRPKLVVPRETKMPAVLVELGFLTNPKEEKLLSTSEYRMKCAKATFNGIVKYFEKVLMK